MTRRLRPRDRLAIATHNGGKLAEIGAMLAPYRLELAGAAALGLAEPEENAADFAGNAVLKAREAARGSGLPALADDSGFCVAALGGAPGVLSARWGGMARDFGAAMRRVGDALGARADRRAWFVCALALAWPDGVSATFLGRVDGQCVWPGRGTRGFGYDPIFVPGGASRTYGEMDPAEKEADSHRTRAFRALAACCLPAPA